MIEKCDLRFLPDDDDISHLSKYIAKSLTSFGGERLISVNRIALNFSQNLYFVFHFFQTFPRLFRTRNNLIESFCESDFKKAEEESFTSSYTSSFKKFPCSTWAFISRLKIMFRV